MRNARHKRTPKYSSGMTLIELMLAMVIGLFLMLGTVTVFTQSRANFRVSDSVARLQENLRFAKMLHDREGDYRVGDFAFNGERLVEVGQDVGFENMQAAAPINAGRYQHS